MMGLASYSNRPIRAPNARIGLVGYRYAQRGGDEKGKGVVIFILIIRAEKEGVASSIEDRMETGSLAATALLAKNLSIKRNRYHQSYNKKYPPCPYWQP